VRTVGVSTDGHGRARWRCAPARRAPLSRACIPRVPVRRRPNGSPGRSGRGRAGALMAGTAVWESVRLLPWRARECIGVKGAFKGAFAGPRSSLASTSSPAQRGTATRKMRLRALGTTRPFGLMSSTFPERRVAAAAASTGAAGRRRRRRYRFVLRSRCWSRLGWRYASTGIGNTLPHNARPGRELGAENLQSKLAVFRVPCWAASS
jgi:hypothetical protein